MEDKNPKVQLLKVGDRVVALTDVWDLPEKKNILAAKRGEAGVVEHVDSCGCTVRFDATGHATTVGDSEVMQIEKDRTILVHASWFLPRPVGLEKMSHKEKGRAIITVLAMYLRGGDAVSAADSGADGYAEEVK